MHTEHDYIQHVKEYETQTLGLWDKLLLVVLGISAFMLFIGLASVGAEAENTPLIIPKDWGDAPSFRIAIGTDVQLVLEREQHPKATVIITVVTTSLVPCNFVSPQPSYTKLSDGTYQRSDSLNTVHAVACMKTERWQEEWSALPEDNGIFLRRVDND